MRFGGLFHRNKGCDTCNTCDSCGSTAPVVTPGHAPATTIPPGASPLPSAAPPASMPKPTGTSIPATSPTSTEGLRRLPREIESKPSTSSGVDLTPTSARGAETESKNPFDLDRRYEKRVGCAADYSKVVGQLYYVHIDGGLWILRYAPLSQEDGNGGSVVLAHDRQLENYHEGDLVSVEGSVIQARANARLGGALYQIRSIQLVERP
jgi:hypothetical protein